MPWAVDVPNRFCLRFMMGFADPDEGDGGGGDGSGGGSDSESSLNGAGDKDE
jgi:hypothetical protein